MKKNLKSQNWYRYWLIVYAFMVSEVDSTVLDIIGKNVSNIDHIYKVYIILDTWKSDTIFALCVRIGWYWNLGNKMQ